MNRIQGIHLIRILKHQEECARAQKRDTIVSLWQKLAAFLRFKKAV
jgi:hypothetical protein